MSHDDDGEVCPMCGGVEHGCTVRDVGGICRAPRRRPLRVLRLRPVARPSFAPSSDPIVRLDVPASARRGDCERCGVAVAWVELPTGQFLAVTLATGEPHAAGCR